MHFINLFFVQFLVQRTARDAHTHTFFYYSLTFLLLLSMNSQINDKTVRNLSKRIYAAKKEFFVFICLLRCMQGKCNTNKREDNSLNYDILYEMQWLNICAHGLKNIFSPFTVSTHETQTHFSYCVLNCVLITAARTLLLSTDSICDFFFWIGVCKQAER